MQDLRAGKVASANDRVDARLQFSDGLRDELESGSRMGLPIEPV